MPKMLLRACLALLCMALTASPASAGRWLRAETSHFVIYGEVGERSIREAARTLELFDAELRFLSNVQSDAPAAKLEVYLLRNQQRLRVVRPNLSEGYLGFYIASPGLIAAFATFRENSGIDAQEVLFHEYAHQFMFQHVPGAYPAWFVEGFAEYVQTMNFNHDRVMLGDFSEGRAVDAMSSQWVPIEQFLNRGDAEFSPVMEGRFYAESWVAAHYLFADPARMARFQAYVDAMEEGADPIADFQTHMGMTPAEFEEQLHRYTRGYLQRRTFPLPQIDISGLQVSALPDAADDLLLPLARLRLGVPQEEIAALTADIESHAAALPDQPFAQRARIRALIARGAVAEARTALEPMLAATPDDAELNQLMGSSYLAEAEAVTANADASAIAAQGRRYFTRAYRIEPNDAPNLFAYAQTYGYGGDIPNSAVDVMVQAYNLAPQVTSHAINIGMILIYHERYDEAAVVLRGVAYAPHMPPSTAEFARRMLTAALQHQQPSQFVETPRTPAQ